MERLIGQIQIQVNENIFIKDPNSSELGKRIIKEAIQLIDKIGLESFTFRKLAKELSTTESSVYRYFESKHKLLIYLTSWYWGWLEYKLVFSTVNMASPEEQLRTSIQLMTADISNKENLGHIDLEILNRIVISESSKAYLTKEVDSENQEGIFAIYKQLVKRVSDIILEIKPDYEYSHMLVSTMMEGAHLQRYFAEHLPRLTDVIVGEDSTVTFYKELVFKAIKN